MTTVLRTRKPRLLALAGIWAALVLVALTVQRSVDSERVREALQARSVDASALGSGDTDDILRRLRLIHPIPPAGLQEHSFAPGSPASRTRFEEAISLDALPPEKISEVFRIDPDWLDRGLPVLSILMDRDDLQELIARPDARGRETEKPGFVAYLEDGELVFSSGVGVRLHGGLSRRYATLRNFRLHFRDAYGSDRFAPPIFPGLAGRSVRQIVVDNNNDGLGPRGHRWHFVDPLSYDIARAIGAPAPETRPALFFLNGRAMGVHILTEYLGLDYLRARYGHDSFVLVRTKRNERERGSSVKAGDPARYRELLDWLAATTPLTMEEAGRRVDLDNLSRWFLTVLFCATGDIFNGPMLLDEKDPEARWFWILWDLEIGFGQPYFPRQGGWQRDIVRFAFLPRHRHNPRSLLLRRLFTESPEYRRFFADLFTEVMNHRLTPEFLAERLDHYRDLAARAALPDTEFFDEIEEFLAHRKAALRGQLAEYLGAGPSFSVHADGPPGLTLTVDGYRRISSYLGWYFAGQSIELSLSGPSRVRWIVNGETQPGPRSVLRLAVEGDLTITVA